MKNCLVATNNSAIKDSFQSGLEKSFGVYRVVFASRPNEVMAKVDNQDFDCILLDLNTIKISEENLKRMISNKLKLVLFCEHFADFPQWLHAESSVQMINTFRKNPYNEIEELLKNKKAGRLGGQISQINLEKDEVVVPPETLLKSIYLVKQGSFVRVNPDNGEVYDEISAGGVIGELNYFSKNENPWLVKAKKAGQLVRISSDKVDTVFNDQPPWFKAMISSLAKRARSKY